ncbi:hypothetical protein [Phytoactinopolyspora mesophila]|uniref:hypothetical protein n=1 Tax=Phytoactinopolyspora mesophila TaxID=2650750 RepID=UPI001C9E24DB|nr:hypothetical protein [Phytoactinopolyspora mesophila]
MRLRIRQLTPTEVMPVNGLPTLTVERTIADLVDTGTDMSLVADSVRDAVRADKLVSRERLVTHLYAIKEAAKKPARQTGPGASAATLAQIRQARFDRFLSRVFADGDQSEWLLKGGMSMLARVLRSRTTQRHGPRRPTCTGPRRVDAVLYEVKPGDVQP